MKRGKRGALAPKIPTTLIAVACFIAGAAGGWGLAGNAPRWTASLPAVRPSSENEETLAKMNAPELRAEVRKLQSAVVDPDSQITELTIRLKIATEGSRSKQN